MQYIMIHPGFNDIYYINPLEGRGYILRKICTHFVGREEITVM